jgi:hypothetical protein
MMRFGTRITAVQATYMSARSQKILAAFTRLYFLLSIKDETEEKKDTTQYKREMRHGRCLRRSGCHKVGKREDGGKRVGTMMTTTNIKIILGMKLIKT